MLAGHARGRPAKKKPSRPKAERREGAASELELLPEGEGVAVLHIVDLEFLGMSEVLEYLTVFIRYSNFHLCISPSESFSCLAQASSL